MMNVLIKSVNSAGARWAAWVAPASLDAAVLLVLIGVVWLAIRDRVAPQVGYWLFQLVPIKLLVPVGVTVPAPIGRWTPSLVATSWFNGARIEGNSAVPPMAESPVTAVPPDQAVPSRPGLASPTQASPSWCNLHMSRSGGTILMSPRSLISPGATVKSWKSSPR
jgi:hypothetical protein